MGDELVVFHRPSGKTHFLNAGSVFLLDEVLRQPKNLAEIIEAFDEALSGSPDQKVAIITDMLSYMEQLGLVSCKSGMEAES